MRCSLLDLTTVWGLGTVGTLRLGAYTNPILRDFHWLPARQRIVFKSAVLAYKCQHVMAPEYLQVYTASQCQLSPADVSGLLLPVDGCSTH